MTRFAGKAAIVTGAGHGIGRASAELLASEGASVAVVDIDAERAADTARALEQSGARALAIACDVSDADEVAAMVAQARDELGRIDVLHNNAGVLVPGTALTQSIEDWDRTFAVNVRGCFLVARAVVAVMLEQGGGAIVNTASTSGIVGEPALAAYDASKGAIVNFTRQLTSDYAPHGIRVNCVCPGWIDTGFNDPIFEGVSDAEIQAMMDQWIPMRRQGDAREIARAVAFLASDDASYITGHALVVDGGLTAQ